jgi:hypothetical protein
VLKPGTSRNRSFVVPPFAMLMPSPLAMPAAGAEAEDEDEESRLQAGLASRILSGRACGWTGLRRSTAAAWSKSSWPRGLSIRRWPARRTATSWTGR